MSQNKFFRQRSETVFEGIPCKITMMIRRGRSSLLSPLSEYAINAFSLAVILVFHLGWRRRKTMKKLVGILIIFVIRKSLSQTSLLNDISDFWDWRCYKNNHIAFMVYLQCCSHWSFPPSLCWCWACPPAGNRNKEVTPTWT